MKIKDGFHPAHYDAVNIESQVKHLRAENLGKGATKRYMHSLMGTEQAS